MAVDFEERENNQRTKDFNLRGVYIRVFDHAAAVDRGFDEELVRPDPCGSSLGWRESSVVIDTYIGNMVNPLRYNRTVKMMLQGDSATQGVRYRTMKALQDNEYVAREWIRYRTVKALPDGEGVTGR